MALIRVAQYNSTPTVVGDYQAQNAHLQAFTNQLLTQQFILDSGTAQPVIKQGAYVSHGGSLYVADADTSITGSPSDGSVYIRVSGTTSLTVEFVTDISGYAWNPVYTALTSGSYTLLPYLIVKASTVWTRYNFNPNNQSFGDTRLNSLAVTGAISGASLAVTGNATVGGTLGVTGVISGASVDTGFGANHVYKISDETVAFGDVSGTDKTMSISTMDIKEIRTVNTTGLVSGTNDYVGRLDLKLPAGGTYFVVGQRAIDSSVASVTGGVFSGGTTVAQIINSSTDPRTFNVGLIVRRIS
jgi:hypothetical protein